MGQRALPLHVVRHGARADAPDVLHPARHALRPRGGDVAGPTLPQVRELLRGPAQRLLPAVRRSAGRRVRPDRQRVPAGPDASGHRSRARRAAAVGQLLDDHGDPRWLLAGAVRAGSSSRGAGRPSGCRAPWPPPAPGSTRRRSASRAATSWPTRPSGCAHGAGSSTTSGRGRTRARRRRGTARSDAHDAAVGIEPVQVEVEAHAEGVDGARAGQQERVVRRS